MGCILMDLSSEVKSLYPRRYLIQSQFKFSSRMQLFLAPFMDDARFSRQFWNETGFYFFTLSYWLYLIILAEWSRSLSNPTVVILIRMFGPWTLIQSSVDYSEFWSRVVILSQVLCILSFWWQNHQRKWLQTYVVANENRAFTNSLLVILL